jgi:hypothetical protein
MLKDHQTTERENARVLRRYQKAVLPVARSRKNRDLLHKLSQSSAMLRVTTHVGFVINGIGDGRIEGTLQWLSVCKQSRFYRCEMSIVLIMISHVMTRLLQCILCPKGKAKAKANVSINTFVAQAN